MMKKLYLQLFHTINDDKTCWLPSEALISKFLTLCLVGIFEKVFKINDFFIIFYCGFTDIESTPRPRIYRRKLKRNYEQFLGPGNHLTMKKMRRKIIFQRKNLLVIWASYTIYYRVKYYYCTFKSFEKLFRKWR